MQALVASRPKRAQEKPQELLDKILQRQQLPRTIVPMTHCNPNFSIGKLFGYCSGGKHRQPAVCSQCLMLESLSHRLHWCGCWPNLLAEELDEEEDPQREPQVQQADERAVDEIGDRCHQRGDGQCEEEREEIDQVGQASAEIWAEDGMMSRRTS